MANKMPREKRNAILRLLVEGNSIRSVCRVMETNIPSVIRQLEWAGTKCAELSSIMLRKLTLRHVECDEIWTYVGKKQARLTVDEKAESSDEGDMYLFTGIDQDTKLCAAHLVGKRSADNCRRFMVALADRLNFPTAHQSDAHAFKAEGYRPIIQLSTDGFAGYPEAVDLAFGAYAKYGTIIKEYKNATMNYTPSEMVGTKREAKRGGISPASICTSHVERNNGTIRLFMKRYNRLTLAFSKKLQNLEWAVNLHMAYYNFCWRSRYSDQSGKCGRLRPTPAMAAKITPSLWSFDKLMGELDLL